MATNQQLTFPMTAVSVPAGFRWSPEDVKRQQERNGFIRVGTLRTTRTGANANAKPVRALSGAIKKWNSADPEEQNAIFNLQYRITGTPENIRTALAYANVPPAEIERVIAESITRDNFATTQLAAYNAELAAHKSHKTTGAKVRSYTISDLVWFANNLPNAKVVSTRAAGAAGAAPAGRAAGGGRRTLAGAYNAAAQSPTPKYIDVSGIDDTTGVGYKTLTKAPRGVIGVTTLPIVSRSFDKYVRALELIFGAGAREQFAAEIEAVRQQAVPQRPAAAAGGFPTAFAAPAAPLAQGFPVAEARPGAALAPAPVLRAAGAPVPAAASPLRTMGGGTPGAGMVPFRQTVQ